MTPEDSRSFTPCSRNLVSVQRPSGHFGQGLKGQRLPRLFCLALLATLLASHLTLAQNRVLDLDGDGSYVELPPNIFTNLTEATVEVWAKWDSFRTYSRVFDFGAAYQAMNVFNHAKTPDLRFNLYPRNAQKDSALLYHIRVNGLLKASEWVHLAAISGPGGMKLYVNGELMGLHTNTASFADIKVFQTNYLGRGTTRNPGDQDLHGQLDEIRVWNHRRSEAQIREYMRKRLTGSEAGLAGLWNFDDGTARDASGRGNHGTMAGNARIITPDSLAAAQLVAAEQPPAPPLNPVAPPANALAVAPANPRDTATWWIAGAMTLIVALLAWLVLMLRRGTLGSHKSLPVASKLALTTGDIASSGGAVATADQAMKDRALAELTEFAKESLVQGLFEQRKALLETHQKAQQELAALETRLVSLHLSDRVQAYEQRIAELEKELESRSGELRELTSATLLLLRRKLEEERQHEHEGGRLN